jgi:outer membrane protein OmpA-like peptidoglycan-associated protein
VGYRFHRSPTSAFDENQPASEMTMCLSTNWYSFSISEWGARDMDAVRKAWVAAGVACVIALAASGPARSADCLLAADFDRAIQSKDLDAAKTLEERIKRDSACGPLSTEVTRQRTLLEFILAAAPENAAKREQLLLDADQPNVLWSAANALGQLRLSQRRFSEASVFFERAIEEIKNPSKTPSAPSADAIKRVLGHASEARLLAANEEGGANAQYAAATRDFRDGTVGGSFSEDVRGITPKSIPLPINFETGTDKPTAIGMKAAAELLAAIKDHPPAEVIIVGHTDERGADDYNMRLSEARARAVAKFLASNGITAKITALGRGKREPLSIDAAGELNKADIWALNRRVEWRRP